MNKKEISEIKKLYKPDKNSVVRICGCYVDGEKNKLSSFKEAFLSLPEEEIFKYFEIFKKSLSGSIGKNLINMEFPTNEEREGGTQNFLYKLYKSELKENDLLNEFYDKVIANYHHDGNYLILVIYDEYDIPFKGTDGVTMEDASSEVYKYILCSLCPVDLDKPGLSYASNEKMFKNKIRNWMVQMPKTAFLFPAFNYRTTDIHNILYYSKKSEELNDDFIESVLGCREPLTAKSQKENFQAFIEETLEETCDMEAVKNIRENINRRLSETEESAALTLDKADIKTILGESGVSAEKMKEFDNNFDECFGDTCKLHASNVVNERSFEIKTPSVTIKVDPERTDLVKTREIDGRKYIVVEINDNVLVDGIKVK